jgi:hypothetical protein
MANDACLCVYTGAAFCTSENCIVSYLIIYFLSCGSSHYVYQYPYSLIPDTCIEHTGHTQKNGAVLIVNTIKTEPFFCVCPVFVNYTPIYVCMLVYFTVHNLCCCRSQWPRGLKLGSSAARLLGSWVRIPPGAWMFVLC